MSHAKDTTAYVILRDIMMGRFRVLRILAVDIASPESKGSFQDVFERLKLSPDFGPGNRVEIRFPQDQAEVRRIGQRNEVQLERVHSIAQLHESLEKQETK